MTLETDVSSAVTESSNSCWPLIDMEVLSETPVDSVLCDCMSCDTTELSEDAADSVICRSPLIEAPTVSDARADSVS